MDAGALEHHLTSPQGLDHVPDGAVCATVGGGSCCDTVTLSLACHDGRRIADAGFSADGCGAALAAGSAAVSLVRGAEILEAARVGPREIAAELGGLSPGKLHAAEVAADALHCALGALARDRAALAAPTGAARTLVAMSGGVDSSVVAVLCAREGPVVAVTLELWADSENDAERSCCSASAVAQARALAHRLGLPHLTLDLRDAFRTGVVDPFIAGFAAGETPNPCVGCNGHVRLDAMLALAERLGCASLATGHYARIVHPADSAEPLLRLAADAAKDQTYMLAAVAPRSIARMRFPLGELTKPQVRAIAAEVGLPVAGKPDSQDLCFLAGTDRMRFLTRHAGVVPRRGEVVDRAGNVLAVHDGHERFTVGQRRGLRLAAGEPLYVLDKDAARNRVTVGPRGALVTDRVSLRAVRLHEPGDRVDRVKLRYRAEPVRARIGGRPGAGRHAALTVELDEPVAGAAPGQMACLLAGETIIGWATIDRPRARPSTRAEG